MFHHSIKRIIIVAIILNMGLLGLYFFMRSKLSSAHELLEEVKVELITIKRQYERVSNEEVRASSLEPLYDKLLQSIIPKEGAIIFIKQLEKAGTIADVSFSVNSVDVREVEMGSKYEYLNTNVIARGSFKNISKLIEILESMPLAMSIAQVRLESGGLEQGEWRATIEILALKLK